MEKFNSRKTLCLGASNACYKASAAISGSSQPAAGNKVFSKCLFLEVLSVYVFISKILQVAYLKFETLLGT